MEVGLGKGQSGTVVQSHKGLDDPDPTGSSGTESSWIEERRLTFIPHIDQSVDVGSFHEGGMTWVKASSRERLSCELSATYIPGIVSEMKKLVGTPQHLLHW